MRPLTKRATGLFAAYAVALQALLGAWLPVAMPSALGADAALCLTDQNSLDGGRPNDGHRICATACVMAASGGATVERAGESAHPTPYALSIVWRPAAEVLPAAGTFRATLPRGPPTA